MNKGENVLTSGLLAPISILEGAWKIITMNFICGVPRSEGILS
jgi:hypothetical protein